MINMLRFCIFHCFLNLNKISNFARYPVRHHARTTDTEGLHFWVKTHARQVNRHNKEPDYHQSSAKPYQR